MDIARGLDKMHSRHIIHLDLKSPNILLTAGGTAKIAVSPLHQAPMLGRLLWGEAAGEAEKGLQGHASVPVSQELRMQNACAPYFGSALGMRSRPV